MKTAQEWAKWVIGHDSEPDQLQAMTNDIAKIQADAYRAGLLRAAQVCRVSNPSGYSNWPVMRENLALAIEAESQKGQT